MDLSFLYKLLIGFVKDNIGPLKQQFYDWLKAQAENTESEVDDDLVSLVAAILGIPE
jgi:hypothetical protein